LIVLHPKNNLHKESEMNRTTRMFTALMSEESGQDLIEYALIAALIALGAIVAMGSLSNSISSEFNSIGNSL
jgi:pilus assembly protein Flp/PilA